MCSGDSHVDGVIPAGSYWGQQLGWEQCPEGLSVAQPAVVTAEPAGEPSNGFCPGNPEVKLPGRSTKKFAGVALDETELEQPADDKNAVQEPAVKDKRGR